jgi:homoserine O-acetyltransferase
MLIARAPRPVPQQPEFPARRSVQLRERLQMRRGGHLDYPVVAYESWGRLNEARDNAVLLFTGLSPAAHAASSAEDPSPGWWEDMIGKGKPIDTERWFVVCVNSLGSPFGSSSPVSVFPRTGRPYGINFPELSIEDIAAAAHGLLRELGIERLACAIGPSLGGMSVLAYATQFPGAVRHVVSISGAARAAPFAIALRSLQREMVRTDPEWRAGLYRIGEGPKRGLKLARKLGTITYRSPEEWEERFGRQLIPEDRQPGGEFQHRFEVEGYLEYVSNGFADIFDANAFMQLSRAMDQFDLAEHGEGSLARACARMQLQGAMVIGVESDILFPVDQQREVAYALRDAGVAVEFHALASLQGHDAFLADLPRFGATIGDYFNRL